MEYRKIWRCKTCQAVYRNRLMSQTEFEQDLATHDDADVSVEGDVEINHVHGVCPGCMSDYYATGEGV